MIDFKNVSKSFGGQDILLDSTFRVNSGEHVGIVGPNGSGKSTLFTIITGDTGVDDGNIVVPNNIRIGYLRQQLNNADITESLLDYTSDAIAELTDLSDRITTLEAKLAAGNTSDAKVLDELGHLQHNYESLGGYNLRSKAEAALSGLGFSQSDFTRLLSEFSGGWQMRASMARVLISDPDVLLLDEPSNYLDIPAVEWLQRYLKSFAGTLLLVSHDRYLLKSLTAITLEIDSGTVVRYAGDYDYYIRERQSRRLRQESLKRNQDKKREQLERGIERFRAKNSKAAQAKSWMKHLDKMEEIVVPGALNYKGVITIPPAPHSGSEMLRLEGVGFSYDGRRDIFSDVDLQIARGDKVAFVGYNGMGKTTLLKVIAGHLLPSSGRRVTGHKVVIGYQAQEFAEILPMEMSVYDIVRAAAPDGDKGSNIRGILGAFGFTGDSVSKPCGVLSGGEKIRLCFARIFVNPPNLLILDEPTTHLDISAREALQKAIGNYDGTVCLVSHDVEFIRGAATSIVAMESGTIRSYCGDYDYYKEKSAERLSSNESNTSASSQSPQRSGGNVKKERRKERAQKRNSMIKAKRVAEKKLTGLESEIEFIDKERSTLTEELNANLPNTDFASVTRRLKELEKKTAKLTAQWDIAAAELEDILAEYSTIK